MRFVPMALGVLWFFSTGVSYAQQNPHATEEVANCLAMHGAHYPAGFCSTPTPVPTATPHPADPPPVAVVAAPTDMPTAGPTPVPDLPVTQDLQYGYLRPTQDDPWMELALPQGRWAIVYDTTLCTAPDPWTNQWLTLDTNSDRPITGNDDGMCAVVMWAWLSNTPCAFNSNGYCDVTYDDSYQYMLSLTPSPTPTDVPPTATPRPAAAPAVATSAPRPVSAPASRPAPAVVQTVIVVATPTPLPDDPSPMPSPTATPSPAPSRTAAPTVSPTAVAVTSSVTPTPEPVAAAAVQEPDETKPWFLQAPAVFFVIGGLIVLFCGLGIGIFSFMSKHSA